MKGFVIAGTGSGSGKTTASLGIMAWLARMGHRVAPFKVGPDFIDPGHHTALTGTPSRNLDSWMLTKEMNQKIFARGCEDRDVAVVEGVMGLYDGYSGVSEAGSTAQMAKLLGLPVVLLVDARSMARSAAAIVKGFEEFDQDLLFAGVIFSKTGSDRHYEYLKEAVEDRCRMKCLGHLPRNEHLMMPERHLGLVTSDEHLISSTMVNTLISMIEEHTDLKKMVTTLPDLNIENEIIDDASPEILNASHGSLDGTTQQINSFVENSTAKKSVRIAVARDKAFCFYYPENLEFMESAGAQLVFFSPVFDAELPKNIDGIYLGGGYPELFAETLSQNSVMRRQIKEKSDRGMPIYGECGGFMYLCSNIIGMDDASTIYPMTGCFPFTAAMSKKMRSLGYREITLEADCPVGKKGDTLKGHEFHYSSLIDETLDGEGIQCIYNTTARAGKKISLQGYQKGNTLGSYMHIHFGSHPDAAGHFVSSCIEFKLKDGSQAE